MKTRQAESNVKRQHENDGSEQKKRQRLETADEPVSTTAKITDVNDFCLIKIFEYLDIQDLLNVADANKRLQPAAINVHQHKFAKNSIDIVDSPLTILSVPHVELDESNNVIKISGLKPSLQYLRCFGQSISDLTIKYNQSKSKRNEHLHEYVNDYCFTSLKRIAFWNMPNIEIQQFQKIFVNVQDLNLTFSDIGQQLPAFIKCFPNLRHFEVISSSMIDRFTKNAPFPYLEHVSFRDVGCNKSFTMYEIIADLLHGIHQLKSLEIKLLNSSDIIGIQRILSEHSALTELDLENYEFAVDDAMALIRQLNFLKKYRFAIPFSKFLHLQNRLDDEWNATWVHHGRCNCKCSFRQTKMGVATLNRKMQ